jgi:hypothetical protein
MVTFHTSNCFYVCVQIKGRLVGIQSWIGFSDEDRLRWVALGIAFVNWIVGFRAVNSQIDKNNLVAQFPVYWNKFLHETNHTDDISLTIT